MNMLACSLVILFVSALAPSVVGDLPNVLVLEPKYDFTLKWEITSDDITIAVGANCRCWLGIGWHCADSSCSADQDMTNTDIVVGTFDPSTGRLDSVMDMKAASQVAPSQDTDIGGQYNILQASGFQTSTYSFFQFKRKLVTNDTHGDHPLVKGSMYVIWAHGNTAGQDANTFGYHGHIAENHGKLRLDWSTGTANQLRSFDMEAWHGALMTLAFGFCLSFGVFNARYLKYYYWWFPLHIMTQMIGVIVAIVALVIAVLMCNGHQFTTVHSFFGLSVLGMSLLAVTMGIISHFLYDPRRLSIPFWPDQLHWWVGRITVLLSYVTIVLGMLLYQVPIILLFVFGGLIFFYLFIYSYLDVYRVIQTKGGSLAAVST